LAGRHIRQALKTRKWDEAQQLVLRMENEGKARRVGETLVNEAIETFLSDSITRNLSWESVKKARYLLKQRLAVFCEEKKLLSLNRISPQLMMEFRAGWPDSAISAQKNFERLRSFFRWCVRNQLIQLNPCEGLLPIRADFAPTLPFTDEEIERIVKACEQFNRGRGWYGKRLRALVLVLLHSGLRISDAVRLSKGDIQDGKLRLRTAKTGTHVFVPLPRIVVDALESFPSASPTRYFCAENLRAETKRGNFDRAIRSVFAKAGISGGHFHRFRDSFAVRMLNGGCSLEEVSILLGHQSIAVTAKHYSPWVASRQERLEQSVKRAWESLAL